LYQTYGLQGFSRFANLLAIAHLRICKSLAPNKNKNCKFANVQLAIVEIWDTLFPDFHNCKLRICEFAIFILFWHQRFANAQMRNCEQIRKSGKSMQAVGLVQNLS
jgi:hypothetical protein